MTLKIIKRLAIPSLDKITPPVKTLRLIDISERTEGWAIGWTIDWAIDPAVVLVPRVMFNEGVAIYNTE